MQIGNNKVVQVQAILSAVDGQKGPQKLLRCIADGMCAPSSTKTGILKLRDMTPTPLIMICIPASSSFCGRGPTCEQPMQHAADWMSALIQPWLQGI